jgi:hypothetical protein
MAVNYRRAHLVVLSEDDATRSLAVGFSDRASGPIEIRKPAGGWPNVLEQFKQVYVGHLNRYADAHVLMLIDFDRKFPTRLAYFQEQIPTNLADRVYILGAEDEAETLKREERLHLGPLGAQLADECRHQKHVHWLCPQLVQNQPEIARLNAAVRRFLF